jgi:hypothetical protein
MSPPPFSEPNAIAVGLRFQIGDSTPKGQQAGMGLSPTDEMIVLHWKGQTPFQHHHVVIIALRPSHNNPSHRTQHSVSSPHAFPISGNNQAVLNSRTPENNNAYNKSHHPYDDEPHHSQYTVSWGDLGGVFHGTLTSSHNDSVLFPQIHSSGRNGLAQTFLSMPQTRH